MAKGVGLVVVQLAAAAVGVLAAAVAGAYITGWIMNADERRRAPQGVDDDEADPTERPVD